MKTKKLFIIILALFINTPAFSDTIFEDSFESGDLATTNSDGFSWGSHPRISIVTMEPQCGGLEPRDPSIIWDDGVICEGPATPTGGGDWSAYSGRNSVRFLYPAGVAQSELRFNLGLAQRDLWISMMLRVPANFSYPKTGDPNKFFALWSDGYSQFGSGSTIWLGMHRDGSGASLGLTYSRGGFTASVKYQQDVPFIYPKDRGRWMQIVIHTKTETSPGASNGSIETWRRWADQSHFIKLHEALNLPIALPSNKTPNGFMSGYILGWANAAYSEDTEWLLDDFIISKSPLIKSPKIVQKITIK